MIGDELAIEQAIAADPQPCDEIGQRDLRRIRRSAEHALAEEGSAQRHAIQATEQRAADIVGIPDFQRVGVAVGMECRIGTLDRRIDPGVGAIAGRFCAGGHDAREGSVGGDDEAIATQRLGQRMRQAEAVEREHTALARLHPKNFRRVAALPPSGTRRPNRRAAAGRDRSSASPLAARRPSRHSPHIRCSSAPRVSRRSISVPQASDRRARPANAARSCPAPCLCRRSRRLRRSRAPSARSRRRRAHHDAMPGADRPW